MSAQVAADLRAAADVLARHYWAGRGMSYDIPDTCSCEARTFPLPGDEDVMQRRARAFAEHQAEMLAAALCAATDRAEARELRDSRDPGRGAA